MMVEIGAFEEEQKGSGLDIQSNLRPLSMNPQRRISKNPQRRISKKIASQHVRI